MRLVILLSLGSIFLGGCRASYLSYDLEKDTTPLSRSEKVFITTPENGTYGNIVYRSSGQQVNAALTKTFSRYVDNVTCSRAVMPLQQAKAEAAKNGCRYLVAPKIHSWADRATEWSGISDCIGIQIDVYDLDIDKRIWSRQIEGMSKWLTFGGDHPQDLLRDPINQFVDIIYTQ